MSSSISMDTSNNGQSNKQIVLRRNQYIFPISDIEKIILDFLNKNDLLKLRFVSQKYKIIANSRILIMVNDSIFLKLQLELKEKKQIKEEAVMTMSFYRTRFLY